MGHNPIPPRDHWFKERLLDPRSVTGQSPDYQAQKERDIAWAKAQYVNGTFTLFQLEQFISQVLTGTA